MPKTLLLMRHAKSSWKTEAISDHERPLNRRGRRAANQMADFLQNRNLIPSIVLSSTAVRAEMTSRLLLEKWSNDVELTLFDSLYHAPPDAYLDAIAACIPTRQIVMCVGHNPGMEELVLMLSGKHEFMSTAAIAMFTTTGEWDRIDRNHCELLDVFRPKEIDT